MVKRLFDIVVASVLLVVLSPFFALVAVLVVVPLGRPVIFSQIRPGRGGHPFRIYKFRTMRPPLKVGGELLDEEARLTRTGRMLRALSLDELPELVNVIRGDMSLVGPRPLLMMYLDRYSPEQARRHDVRPGITGWAQIHGRNALSWERKFELDVYYVDHRSFALDLVILLRTVAQVLRPTGVTEPGAVTSSEFVGSGAE